VRFLFYLLLTATLSALTGAAWVAHRPALIKPHQELKGNAKPRDLVDDLKQAVIKGSSLVEISEGEVNRHLARVLSAKANVRLDSWVKFERLHVDLKPEVAEVTLVWDMHGHRSTATVDLTVSRLEKVFRVEVTGGAYGHLRVPRGLLRPLSPALQSLSETLHEEIQALFQMNEVRIAQDKLVLDPRFP
jgi:hypothetical protein